MQLHKIPNVIFYFLSFFWETKYLSLYWFDLTEYLECFLKAKFSLTFDFPKKNFSFLEMVFQRRSICQLRCWLPKKVLTINQKKNHSILLWCPAKLMNSSSVQKWSEPQWSQNPWLNKQTYLINLWLWPWEGHTVSRKNAFFFKGKQMPWVAH